VVGREAGIGAQQAGEAADEQTGSDEEQQGERDLADD